MAVKVKSALHKSPAKALPSDHPVIPVEVVKTTDGAVTWEQKVQGAYKAIVAFVGTLVVLLTQVGPFAAFLPAQFRPWIGGALVFLTALSTFLVENQKWIDKI